MLNIITIRHQVLKREKDKTNFVLHVREEKK